MESLWLSDSSFFQNTTTNIFPKNKILETDICIVGAGIFGTTCAYYLTKLGYNVIVLEKNKIGEKATRKYYCQNNKSTFFIL